MQPSSHTLDRLGVEFDDAHLVANAGLLLPATLAQHLGLREVVEQHLDLGDAPGRANVGDKAMSLIHSMLAGGDSIDDTNVLRAGATQGVLGHAVLAPSTLGTFLRSFTGGHVRQLDAVGREMLRRAWEGDRGPGDRPLTIDMDSTICQVFGVLKQGVGFGYTKVRGYHPLLATRADTGEVLHSRLRGGSAYTARGAAGFLAETFSRVRHAGATGQLTLRADSGFYSKAVLAACRRAGVRFSVTARLDKAVQRAIAAIPEEAWVPIPYWSSSGTFGEDEQGQPVSGADVAEIPYTAFGKQGMRVRLIVRRVRPPPGSQLALFTEFRYHALVTDREARPWSWRRTTAVMPRWRLSSATSRKGPGWLICLRDDSPPTPPGWHFQPWPTTWPAGWWTSACPSSCPPAPPPVDCASACSPSLGDAPAPPGA